MTTELVARNVWNGTTLADILEWVGDTDPQNVTFSSYEDDYTYIEWTETE